MMQMSITLMQAQAAAAGIAAEFGIYRRLIRTFDDEHGIRCAEFILSNREGRSFPVTVWLEVPPEKRAAIQPLLVKEFVDSDVPLLDMLRQILMVCAQVLTIGVRTTNGSVLV